MCGLRLLTCVLLFAVATTHAQVKMAPLSTFGTGGWLAPNGLNGSTYTYLTTNDTERGLAYGNGHLYLVSRNGGDFVRILDPQTGQDLGALNLGTGIVSGGTFDVNMIVVGGDGAIYVANLAIAPDVFRVYRWANDLPGTTPTVAYNGMPLAGSRIGDSLAAIGGGAATRLAAGFNSAPAVAGNNGYAILDPTAGTATAVNFSGAPPAAGDFRLSIGLLDASHVVGTPGGSGSTLDYTSFSGGTGTYLAGAPLASTDERPVSFAVVGGIPMMAALSTVDNHVSVYDMTDPTQPVLLGQANATTGTLPTDSHNTGAVAWGAIGDTSATLYAMASDDGIQAFQINLPEPAPPAITSQPEGQTTPELASVTFSVVATGNPVPTYKWIQGTNLITGATNASYTIPAVPYRDNAVQFQVIVQNTFGNAVHSLTSSVATLTVLPDTTPPVLLGARSLGLSQVVASFSERVDPATATNVANYSITNTASALVITGAGLDASQSNVVLAVTGMTEESTYTLTVHDLRDQSAAGNVMAPGARADFVSSSYTLAAIGNPAITAAQQVVAGGVDITAGGAGFGGSNDEGSLSYQMRTGNFDVALRVAGLSLSDVSATAGLMARETLDPGSRFAAALTTPAMVGSFFEVRDPAGSASRPSGSFGGNFPYTWLRLRRAGGTFLGYASYDGQTWTLLGTASISMASQVYLGFTVSSHNARQPAVAQFRDVADVTSGAVGMVVNPSEPPGPCSRRTEFVISEIMYKPAARADGRQLEFVELYNSNPWWDDISGYRLAGDIAYTFPAGTIVPGGGFLVIARAPADVESVCGITNVVGPYANSLKKSGTIQFLSDQGAVLLEVAYDSKLPWSAGAAGTGHSIVLARPSYGEADPRAWALSGAPGGSPGAAEAFQPSPLQNVVINEFLAHPTAAQSAYVELYNHSNRQADLSGCVLTDGTANQFVMPTNTVIPAAGFLSFGVGQLGFALNPAGGLLLLKGPDGRVFDAVSYEPQRLNVSSGRWPDGASEFYPLATNTPGAPNGDILIGDIVLNEIMYRPISNNDDDQYVELFNRGTNTVDLGGWAFTAGITFSFPANTFIAPGGYLVVARNAANLFAHYPQLNSGNTVGNFGGNLPHKGGRLALARPEDVVTANAGGGLTTNTVLAVEDEVTYQAGGRWGQWAHGGGSSLELIDPLTNHRLAANWADSDETAKSAWTNLEVTGLLDNGANYGSGVDLVQLGLLDVGECLVDNVEVRPSPTGANYIANADFESGMTGWTPQGSHIRSGLETALGGYQSRQCLHVRASDRIWTLFNSVQGTLTNITLHAGNTATLRLKARWLHGSPEILMRLHGNWLELTGALPVPTNLGTPGLPNSQATGQPGPAIFEVKHSPAIPPANQAVLVTARFHDVTGVRPTLAYRIDTTVNPNPTYTTVPMVDDGTGGDLVAGDGIYTGRIPAQPAGRVVAFIVQVRNPAGIATSFPADLHDNSGLPRECVVVFGDPAPLGSFGHQHLWLTQNWINRWSRLGGLSNENQDGTLVDGSGRIIYDWQGRYAGSPYHQYLGSPVTTTGGLHGTVPDDDQLYGTTSFNKLHVPGNGPLDDDTLQREQTSYWMARQLGVPWTYRRYFIMYVNGNRHGPLMEDAQVPNSDMVKEYFPYDNNGFLYKNMGWFEGSPGLDGSGYENFTMPTWCLLGKFLTTINGVPGQYKLARYRCMYVIHQYPDSANNYTNIFALITAANAPTTTFATNLEPLVDIEEWMRMSALEHATGDWDSWFTQNQWNMYLYKPIYGRFVALKWDWNITLGSGTQTWPPDGSQLFNSGSNDPIMARLHTYAPYRRAYLRAFKEIADRAMNTNIISPVLDAKYAAFVANGLTTTAYNGVIVKDPGAAGGLKSWIGTMHTSLLRALTNQGVANVSFSVDGPTNVVTGTNAIYVTGVAPLEVNTIVVNGAPLPVAWTSTKTWRVLVPLGGATNSLTFAGLDLAGFALTNDTAAISVVNTNAVVTPLQPIRINEWMANNNHVLVDLADGTPHDWLELCNPNPVIVDVSGYFLTDKLTDLTKWQIPPGTAMAPNGFLLVWADAGLSGTDSALHANFNLSKAGSVIALCDPEGNLVDSVNFGAQSADISQGRWPDGAADIYFMPAPTPGSANQFVNSPPVLAPLADEIVRAGSPVTFTAIATDPDAPPQTLTFSLDAGAPAGAMINATSGVFTWTPSTSLAPGTNAVTVRVTDNGVPPLSVAQTLTVVVQTSSISMTGVSLTPDGRPTFSWATQPGRTYRVEWKADINDPAWQPLEDLNATGGSLTFADSLSPAFTQRFYQIELLP